MFFNGFTLLLVFVSIAIGFLWGIRYENDYQNRKRTDWLDGEGIEAQMNRDGWSI